MSSVIVSKLSAFHIFEGLRDGLSHFSGPSRVAIMYAMRPDDPLHIYDPQHLLRGHEPKLKKLYISADEWRRRAPNTRVMNRFSQPYPAESPQLDGMISTGGYARSIFYQMWFTEHHPDMCSVGPTERWLERAVWLLAQDIARKDDEYTGASEYVIREYAPHAVRDYIVDDLNRRVGMDIQIRIYPILDAVLGISRTMEEGSCPCGDLVIMEPRDVARTRLAARFPRYERPELRNHKHVRKLLQAVEMSCRKLISDGAAIVGIADKNLPATYLRADFQGRHGFLSIGDDIVCSFADGNFHSSVRRDKLVQLEEFLLEADLDPPSLPYDLFKVAAEIVHHAEASKFGCTLVIDIHEAPIDIAGQHFETPVDLTKPEALALTKSLAKLDGALHIGADMRLHGFACILDGNAVPGEDRSRGARFNSALRFTAKHRNIIVVVVSSDRPVSVIQEGVALSAQCAWEPVSARLPSPPFLSEWVDQ